MCPYMLPRHLMTQQRILCLHLQVAHLLQKPHRTKLLHHCLHRLRHIIVLKIPHRSVYRYWCFCRGNSHCATPCAALPCDPDCHPTRQKNREKKKSTIHRTLAANPVRDIAHERNIPLLQPIKIDRDAIATIAARNLIFSS